MEIDPPFTGYLLSRVERMLERARWRDVVNDEKLDNERSHRRGRRLLVRGHRFRGQLQRQAAHHKGFFLVLPFLKVRRASHMTSFAMLASTMQK